ncbi:PilW family protein [Psychromonas antarctica]|uniref:PilW family protein n=1 Tax=Psychromonas antarctica TaxID=67573 RepID=UPI001EE88CD7|nr:prepilin-type N-terminal cleavage/methylation domain-containing protein [Psychromonas antarctica]MCG6200383.1 prepilin-type N-terminal cleavage/methylation domain-containing protein [Psychromonas antarctica]
MAGKKGFSLIEMLISLLLGSVLLAMVIGLYVTGVSSGAKSLKYSRLRTDLQSMMSMMETDIRRAGYGGNAFLVGSGASKTVDSINHCIIYYYNHDSVLSITDANKMAFRFVPAKNEIQFGTGVGPLASDCYSPGNGSWTALSDKNFIKITALNFTENAVSSASATMRSVQIILAGELVSDNRYSHVIKTKVSVRNIEVK